jgi:hypothetical protein
MTASSPMPALTIPGSLNGVCGFSLISVVASGCSILPWRDSQCCENFHTVLHCAPVAAGKTSVTLHSNCSKERYALFLTVIPDSPTVRIGHDLYFWYRCNYGTGRLQKPVNFALLSAAGRVAMKHQRLQRTGHAHRVSYALRSREV